MSATKIDTVKYNNQSPQNSEVSPKNASHENKAFIVKVFSHWLHEEEDEVREVRLDNIENENEVMDLLVEAQAFEKASIQREAYLTEEQIEAAIVNSQTEKTSAASYSMSQSPVTAQMDQQYQNHRSRGGPKSQRLLRHSFEQQRTEPVSQFLVQKEFAVKNETHSAISMDYCSGGELYMLLRAKKRFSIAEAQFYAATILQGLEALHMANVVYRDLKPENVLIDADGYTKLCDFGLSIKPSPSHLQAGAASIADDASSSSSVSSSSVVTKKSQSGKPTTTFFGTMEYSPPEFFCKQEYSGQSDLWAFGCLLYEFVVGFTPFSDFKGNSRSTIRRILQNQPDLRLIRVPGNRTNELFLCDLIARLLTKDPSQRPQSVREVKQHSWFANIDWDQICHKKYKAPFIPRDVMKMKFYKENNRLPETDEDAYIYDTRFFAPKQTNKDIAPLQEVIDRLIATGTIIPNKILNEQAKNYSGRLSNGFGALADMTQQHSMNCCSNQNTKRKWSEGSEPAYNNNLAGKMTQSMKMMSLTINASLVPNKQASALNYEDHHTKNKIGAQAEADQDQLTRTSTMKNIQSSKSIASNSFTSEPS